MSRDLQGNDRNVSLDAARPRARFQTRESGRVRTQPRDPVTGHRRSITARDPGELAARCRVLEEVRRDLAYGVKSPQEAARVVTAIVEGRLTVADVWKRYAAGVRARSKKIVASTWTRRLEPSFGKLAAFELDKATMQAWEEKQLSRGTAPKTVRNAYDLLAAAYRLAIAGKRLTELPWENWRPRKIDSEEREACRSLEELATLIRVASSHDAENWRAGVFSDLACRVLVIGLCGLRQGEAAGLAWEDLTIDAPPSLMVIRHQVTDGWQREHPEWLRPIALPKGDKRRTQALHPSVIQALRHQREQLRRLGWYRLDGPVFPGKGGKWRTHAEVIKPERFRTLVRDAGLPNVARWTTHSLRHSFATLEVIASGGDLRSTQARTGHSSLEQLATYMHRAGRGIPASQIPELPADVVPMTITVLPESSAPPLLPQSAELVDLMLASTEKARQFQAEADQRRRETRERNRRKWRDGGVDIPGLVAAATLEEVAEWKRSGSRPPQVTAAIEACYRRAYNKAKRAGGDAAAAQAAGHRARRAALGNWGRQLSKRLGGAPCGE